jgi:hypothetical protein
MIKVVSIILLAAWGAMAATPNATDDAWMAQGGAPAASSWWSTNGCVWALTFDATNAADSSPIARNPNISGGVSFTNGEMILNGTSGFLTLSNSTEHAFTTGPFSVAFWAKKNGATWGGTYPNFVGKFGDGAERGWLFYKDSTNITAWVGADFRQTIRTPGAGWFHVVFVKNTTNGTLYVNGQYLTNAPAGNAVGATKPTVIGIHYNNITTYGYLAAYLDDIFLYSRELNASEIAALYQHGKDSGK